MKRDKTTRKKIEANSNKELDIPDVEEKRDGLQERAAAEFLYQQLVEHLPVVVYTVPIQEGVVPYYVSPQMAALTGYPPEDWERDGKMKAYTLHPEEKERALAMILQARDRYEPYDLEFRILTVSGEERWVHDHSAIVHSPEGVPLYYQGFVEDITVHKQAEVALQRREQEALQFSEKLKRLHEMSMRLARTPDLETLCRQAVEEGRSQLGFDRLSAWLYNKDHSQLLGMCGTDEVGNTRDERGQIWEVETAWLLEFTDSLPVNLRYDAPLLDEKGEQVGQGWHATVALRDGENVIGVLAVDNLLRHAPLQEYQKELLGLFGALVGNLCVRKQNEEALQGYLDQLHNLNSHLHTVREEERGRIAREVHDELGQPLTGLKMSLAEMKRYAQRNAGGLSSSMVIEKVAAMNELIETTISTVRRIATELRPAILDTFGLLSALKWQAQDFQNRTGIVCKLLSPLEEVSLDKERVTAVFRIFQESLTNVWRHANATRVQAKLEECEGALILTVQDNGKGIHEAELIGTRAVGIFSMRERAHLLGGEVQILGTPKRGTTVKMTMPMRPPP